MKPEGKPIAGNRPEVAESNPLPQTISVPLAFPTHYFLFVPIHQLHACSILRQSDPSLSNYPNNILRRIGYKL
jgi:hypothetical protein